MFIRLHLSRRVVEQRRPPRLIGEPPAGEAHCSGEEPLAFWRQHLKKASDFGMKNFRMEWRRHLNEAERRWIR
jgi:hypothetical protein